MEKKIFTILIGLLVAIAITGIAFGHGNEKTGSGKSFRIGSLMDGNSMKCGMMNSGGMNMMKGNMMSGGMMNRQTPQTNMMQGMNSGMNSMGNIKGMMEDGEMAEHMKNCPMHKAGNIDEMTEHMESCPMHSAG